MAEFGVGLHSGDRVYIRTKGWQTVMGEVAHRLLLKDAQGVIHDYPPSAKWEREILLSMRGYIGVGHLVVIRTQEASPGGPAGSELAGVVVNRSEKHDCNALLDVIVSCVYGRKEPKLLPCRIRAWQVVAVMGSAPLVEEHADA